MSTCLKIRFGAPVYRPFFGIERERFPNGAIWRVSLWPMRFGWYLVHWWERRV